MPTSYMSGYERNKPEAEQVVFSKLHKNKRLVTDDRPYIRILDFDNYNLFPSIKKLTDNRYYRSWIKITTLIIVLVVLLFIVSAFYLTKTEMPPMYITSYHLELEQILQV